MNARSVLRVGIEVVIVATAIALPIYCFNQQKQARTEAAESRADAEQARRLAADQQKLAADRQSELDTAREREQTQQQQLQDAAAKLEAAGGELASSRAQVDSQAKDLARQQEQLKDATQRAELHRAVLEGMTQSLLWNSDEKPMSLSRVARAGLKNARQARGTINPVDQAAIEFKLGYNLIMAHDPTGAEPILRSAFSTRQQKLGPNEPDTVAAMARLAWSLSDQGKWEEAVEVLRQADACCEQNPEPNKEHRDSIAFSLASNLMYLQRPDDAEPWAWKYAALPDDDRKLTNQHITAIKKLLLPILESQKKFQQAEALIRRVIASVNTGLIYTHNGFEARCWLAMLLRDQGKLAESDALDNDLDETAKFLRDIEQPVAPLVYGKYLLTRGKLPEAEYFLLRAMRNDDTGSPDVSMNETYRAVVQLYESQGRYDRASEYRGRIIQAQSKGSTAAGQKP